MKRLMLLKSLHIFNGRLMVVDKLVDKTAFLSIFLSNISKPKVEKKLNVIEMIKDIANFYQSRFVNQSWLTTPFSLVNQLWLTRG